jgi:hypothetical protein
MIRPADPRLRVALLAAFYLLIELAAFAMASRTSFSTAHFIYQGF